MSRKENRIIEDPVMEVSQLKSLIKMISLVITTDLALTEANHNYEISLYYWHF